MPQISADGGAASSPLAPDWLAVPQEPNFLDPGVWPLTMRREPDGQLSVGGVGVRRLAEQFGTPLYVLDRETAVSAARETRAAFVSAANAIGTSATVYYASKAFASAQFLRWMVDEGLNVDVASRGELELAIAAGVPPERIGLHGNNKSDDELARAVAVGVGTIVIDSAEEVAQLRRLLSDRAPDRRQRVRLRVTTGVHASTHEYLATATEDQKFGVPLAQAEEVVASIRSVPHLEFVGLHSHIGSQIFGADGFREAVRRMFALHAKLLAGGPVPELNLGGGYGIAYTEADRPEPIGGIATAIAQAVAAEATRAGVPVPRLSFEPGRSIVGRAGVTLYTAGVTKTLQVQHGGASGERRYVSVDGGMSDNPRPELYGADYEAALASRTSQAPVTLTRVVGKHCESGDVIVHDDYLPADLGAGDLVAVAATGAYCFTLASNYNLLPRPAVVAVQNGRAAVLIHGQTIADVLRRDAGLDWTSEGSEA